MIAVENRERTCPAHMLADPLTKAFGLGTFTPLSTVPDPNNPSVQLNLPDSDIRAKIWQSIYFNPEYKGKKKEDLYPIYVAKWRDYLMSLPSDQRAALYSTSVASASSTLAPPTSTPALQAQNGQNTQMVIAPNPNAPKVQNTTNTVVSTRPQPATNSLTTPPQGNAVPWWYYAAGAAALYFALRKK